MACISTNHEGARKIIRKTARLAAHYQAKWIVLYIQTPRESLEKVDLAMQRKLINNLKWAAELGAEVIRKQNDDVPEAIFETAIENEITNVVLGRPHFSLYRQISGHNYFDKLLRKISDTEIDVIIVF